MTPPGGGRQVYLPSTSRRSESRCGVCCVTRSSDYHRQAGSIPPSWPPFERERLTPTPHLTPAQNFSLGNPLYIHRDIH